MNMGLMEHGVECTACGTALASGHEYCRRCGAPRQGSTGLGAHQEEWTCMTCGMKVSAEFQFCPNCGRPSIIPYSPVPFPAQQPEYRDDPTGVHYILYALSLLVPLLGFLLGFSLTRSEHSEEDRHAGKVCIIMAFFWPLVITLFIIRILVLL
jgi:hypothetical protein